MVVKVKARGRRHSGVYVEDGNTEIGRQGRLEPPIPGLTRY